MIQRTAVRALLVAPPDLLLLTRIYIPDREGYIWITPGGGIEDGEQPEEALLREVKEETAHELGTFVGPVWRRNERFRFRGVSYQQEEFFYLAHCEQFDPDHSENPAEIEQEIFDRFRWWSLREIAASSEVFAPGDLARHLARLLNHEVPATPIQVGA